MEIPFSTQPLAYESFDSILRVYRPRSTVKKDSYFINNSNKQITIVERSGIKIPLYVTDLNIPKNSFTIFTTITLPSCTKNTAEALLSVNRYCESFPKEMYQASVRASFETDALHNSIIINWSVTIPIDDVEKLGGNAYYPELDLLVSLNEAVEVPDHPFSSSAQADTYFNKVTEQQKEGVFYNILFIDNRGEIGTRYLSILDHTTMLKGRVNAEMEDGIYIRSSEGACTYIPPHMFDTVGIATTAEKAMGWESTTDVLKEKINTLNHEKELQKRKDEIADREKQIEFMREKERIQRADMEREAYQEKMKHAFEMQQMERRDSSEALKVVGSVILGIGAIFMAAKKFF